MVQNIVREPGPYSRPYWQGDRLPMDSTAMVEDTRYRDSSAAAGRDSFATSTQFPMTMGEMIRRYCRVPAACYFVAILTDEGKLEYFAGPNQIPNPERIFNAEAFLRSQGRSGSVASSSQGEENPFEDDERRSSYTDLSGRRRRPYDRRHPELLEDPNSAFRTTKRVRSSLPRRDTEEAQVTMKKSLRISDSDAVWEFYGQRFRNCQQTACKLIAKAWVKAVEPRKQSTHPYTGPVAPDWWPKPWGPGGDSRVRHKEPDHLLKPERVHLLKHILRMIVEPKENQHADIRNLDLNVAKLEEVTMECLNSFLSDKENPKNAQKKPYLKEIFKVAKFEQRYKNGEIDGKTEVFVMAEDKLPENYQSDEEEDENDEEQVPTPTNATIATNTAPMERTATIQAPAHDGGTTYLGDLHPPQIVTAEGLPSVHHHAYVDNTSIGHQPLPTHGPPMTVPDIIPGTHDTSRRTSVFSPTDFPTSSGTGLYGGGWQQGTTAPGTAGMYAYTPNQPHSPQQAPGQGFLTQAGVPMGQPQQYLTSSFDGIPRPYDTSQSQIFRSATVTSPAVVPQPQGYQNYMTQEDRQNAGMKLDNTLGRNTLH